MSVNRDYYVIAGVDLTGLQTDKFNEWRWTDEGEQWFCYHRKGKIQLFDDPMCGDYLYLGFILAAGDEFDCPITKFDIIDVNGAFEDVALALNKLRRDGVITQNSQFVPQYKMIAFVEYS